MEQITIKKQITIKIDREKCKGINGLDKVSNKELWIHWTRETGKAFFAQGMPMTFGKIYLSLLKKIELADDDDECIFLSETEYFLIIFFFVKAEVPVDLLPLFGEFYEKLGI